MEAFISSAVMVPGVSTDDWAIRLSFCARDEISMAQTTEVETERMSTTVSAERRALSLELNISPKSSGFGLREERYPRHSRWNADATFMTSPCSPPTPAADTATSRGTQPRPPAQSLGMVTGPLLAIF